MRSAVIGRVGPSVAVRKRANQPHMHTNIYPQPATAMHPLALTETQLSRLLSLSVSFLQHDRAAERRIPFYKIGKAVRYSLPRVQEALATMEEGGTLPAKRRPSARA